MLKKTIWDHFRDLIDTTLCQFQNVIIGGGGGAQQNYAIVEHLFTHLKPVKEAGF